MAKKKSLFDAVFDEISTLPSCPATTIKELRELVEKHIFNYLDYYVDFRIPSDWREHPVAVVLSREFKITLVIVTEKSTIIFKQKNSLKTIYLAYDNNNQYSSCKPTGIFSFLNLDDLIKKHPVDITLPERLANEHKSMLFNTLADAITKTVNDSSYLSWIQILLGPKNIPVTKKQQMELIAVENELHLTLLALNAVIKMSIPLIDNNFFETFLQDMIQYKSVASLDIEKKRKAKQNELKDLQLDIEIFLLKIKGVPAEKIEKFKEDFLVNYVLRKVEFNIPDNATNDQRTVIEINTKDQAKYLSDLDDIAKNENELLKNLITLPQLIEKTKVNRSKIRDNILSKIEDMQWYEKNREDIPNHVRNAVNLLKDIKDFIDPKNISGNSQLDEIDLAFMYKSNETYKKHLEKSLSKIRFVLEDSYEITREKLLDDLNEYYKVRIDTIKDVNKERLVSINKDKINGTVLAAFLDETFKDFTKNFDFTITDYLKKNIPLQTSFKFSELVKILETKALELHSKYVEMEKTINREEIEKSKYKTCVIETFSKQARNISPFVSLIPAETFVDMIIAAGVYRSPLELLCDSSSGDSLLHKASSSLDDDSEYKNNNAIKIIKVLMDYGANIFVKNNKREFACDLTEAKYQPSLAWSLAQKQLENLLTHGTKLLDLILQEILNYITYNSTSWKVTFHNKPSKHQRLQLVWKIMVDLNASRFDVVDPDLLETLNQARNELFSQSTSYLRVCLVKIYAGATTQSILGINATPLHDLKLKLDNKIIELNETKEQVDKQSTENNVLRAVIEALQSENSSLKNQLEISQQLDEKKESEQSPVVKSNILAFIHEPRNKR